MKIITASAAGMCFGVRDALEMLAQIDQPQSVAIHGELVHNEVVLHQLQLRGFQQVASSDRSAVPETSQVVITAHGISDRRRLELIAAGKELIDTTCPLVTRAHRAAQELASSGAFVVVIGRANHVEVQGITGDLDAFVVVANPEDVATYPSSTIGVMCQTTFPLDAASLIRQRIVECNPTAEIRWIDTICQPTKDRQQALNELLDQVDAVVVVGGGQSHNTKRLVEACHQRGRAALHVQDETVLEPRWFEGYKVIGLTAGTSTLPETIDRVYARLCEIAATHNVSNAGADH